MNKIAIASLLLCLSSAFSFVAHASLYKLDYSGYVTESNSTDFTVGDLISGTFDINLGKADRQLDSADSLSFRSESGRDFIKGYFSPSAEHFDYISFYNSIDPDIIPRGPMGDGFNISDYSRKLGDPETYTESMLYILSPVDWLGGTDFSEFEFLESDLQKLPIAHSFGGFFISDLWDPNDTEIRFKLTYAKLHAANVPEPSSILLILLACCAIFLQRKFHKFN
jgi:multisubunit Na+/H+ antiporter MnhG subunit